MYCSLQTTYELNQKLRLQNDKFGYLPSAGASSNDEVNGVGGTPPDLPPRIDRTSKPLRNVNGRSAQERLFGANGTKEHTEPPNYINATSHHRLPNSTSLGRHNSNANSSTNMNNKTVCGRRKVQWFVPPMIIYDFFFHVHRIVTIACRRTTAIINVPYQMFTMISKPIATENHIGTRDLRNNQSNIVIRMYTINRINLRIILITGTIFC